jgi:hypothetical protein
MTTTSSDSLPAARKAGEIESPEEAKDVHALRHEGRRKTATASWYGRLLIVSTLLVAAGWELFRWIIAIITLD